LDLLIEMDHCWLWLRSWDRDLLMERDRNMLSLADALRDREMDFCDTDLLRDWLTLCDLLCD